MLLDGENTAEDSGYSNAVIQLCSGDAFSQLCVGLSALGFRRLTGLRVETLAENSHAYIYFNSSPSVIQSGNEHYRVLCFDDSTRRALSWLLFKKNSTNFTRTQANYRALLLVGAVLRLVQSHATSDPAAPRGPLRYSAWTTSIQSRY